MGWRRGGERGLRGEGPLEVGRKARRGEGGGLRGLGREIYKKRREIGWGLGWEGKTWSTGRKGGGGRRFGGLDEA